MTTRRQGQSLVEYVTVIIALVAALVWMFPYIRSALTHRYKTGADGIGHGMLFY